MCSRNNYVADGSFAKVQVLFFDGIKVTLKIIDRKQTRFLFSILQVQNIDFVFSVVEFHSSPDHGTK